MDGSLPDKSTGLPLNVEQTTQDLQRAALRDLVALSAECSVQESRIERHRQSVTEKVTAEFESTRAEIESRRQSLAEDLRAKEDEFLSQIQSRHEADMNTLTGSSTTTRQGFEGDYTAAEREIKQKFTQAEWLATTVFEATQNQLREQAKEGQRDLAERRKHLALLDQQTSVLMQFYQCPEYVEEEDDEQEAAKGEDKDPSPEAEAPGSYDERYAQVGRYLEDLGALRLPRLVVGIWPFMVGLVLCVLAAGLTQLVMGMSVAHWHAIGIVVAVIASLVIVGWLVLRRMARLAVQTVYDPLWQALRKARLAAEREYEESRQAGQKQLADATHRRDSEVREARQRFEPLLSRAAHNRDAGLQALEDEQSRIVPMIEQRRSDALAEVEAWRKKAFEELEQGYQNEIQAAQRRRDSLLEQAEITFSEESNSLERRWRDGLARIQAPIHEKGRLGQRLFLDWDDPAWSSWEPPRQFTPVVRFGELRIDLKQITDQVPRKLALPESFSVPAVLALARQGSLLIHTNQTGRQQAIRTLQAVMMRLLTCLPAGSVRFTIIDPIGLGQNFAGFMHLADHDEALVSSRIWTNTDHIEARLTDLTEHMETVIQKYLRNEFETIDDYNAQAGELAEPYRFLVIADFPVNFSDEAIKRLCSIASSGARCGVYTLVARDIRQSLPAGSHVDELTTHSVNLVQDGTRFAWKDEVFSRFPLTLDPPPSEEFLTRILHVVGRHAKEAKRVEVPFETIAPSPSKIWSSNSREDVAVPIGRMGATRLQMLRLGHGVAQHVLIAGKTGSGKSTLLHVLVTNLALWYHPDEVEFYLVDFKKGVEFKAYATSLLPHARAIAVESDREFGLSVLQRMDSELTRRGTLFRKLGVQDLPSYREASGRPLPRTLLIIDEFQEFFSEDDRLAQDAGLLLDRLVRQGRAFGIHVLLGSQTIGGTSGLARSTLGQMAVRIALQTSEADSQIILGDGNSAARLLSRPGEAIYNDAGGLVEGNSPFQVAWLPDERRDKCLALVGSKTSEAGIRRDPPVVFEGNVPADIVKNESLAALLASRQSPDTAGVVRMWLGEPVAIKEPTAVTFRRQSGCHLLIIGQQEEAAMAMMAGGMIALAAQHSPSQARFIVLDGSPADSPLARVFGQVKDVLPHRIDLVEYRAVADAIGDLAGEIERRQFGEEATPPAIFLFVYGLQRYRVLRRQEDGFSFSMDSEGAKSQPDRQLADLLREGPPLGIHVIAWCDTHATVERSLDRNSLREIDNRVLFQMSAADSSNLIDSPLANKLGVNRALAYSEEQGTTEKFRPYALPPAAWLARIKAQWHR